MRFMLWFVLMASIGMTGCVAPSNAARAIESGTAMPPSVSPATPTLVSLPPSRGSTNSIPSSPPAPGLSSATRTIGLAGASAPPPAAQSSSSAANTAAIQVTPGFSGATRRYANAKLGLALDYPRDWSVTENSDGATFKSPQGAIIQLESIDPNLIPGSDLSNEMRLPNTSCRSTTNPHGLDLQTCLDTISFTYTASIYLQSSNGTRGLAILITRARGTPDVFNAMLASVQRIP